MMGLRFLKFTEGRRDMEHKKVGKHRIEWYEIYKYIDFNFCIYETHTRVLLFYRTNLEQIDSVGVFCTQSKEI